MEEFKSDIFSLLDQYSEWKKQMVLDAFHLTEVVSSYISKSNCINAINIVNCVNANENTNSRILCALLSYRKGDEFPILKSFIDKFFGDRFNHSITNPEFSAETKRIDLLIQDKDYCIIFENKIFDAKLQNNQIARYIIKERKEGYKDRQEGYKDRQIYVVFLPSSFNSEYDMDCCWRIPDDYCSSCDGKKNEKCKRNESLKDTFKERTTETPFRNSILPWLKQSVLPLFDNEESISSSAIIQYIDYLEGLYGIRQINIQQDMELKQKLSECLGFTGDPIEDQAKVTQKIVEIDDLRNQLSELEVKCYDECFQSFKERLSEEYPDNNVILHNNTLLTLDFSINKARAQLVLEYGKEGRKFNLWYGIHPIDEKDDVKSQIEMYCPRVFETIGYDTTGFYLCWRYIEFRNAFDKMKEIMNIVRNIK